MEKEKEKVREGREGKERGGEGREGRRKKRKKKRKRKSSKAEKFLIMKDKNAWVHRQLELSKSCNEKVIIISVIDVTLWNLDAETKG